MKVFISWSGERSKQLAEAIREWLPNVLQFVKPYFTPADIEKGARWASEISKELEQSKIGIIAMTEENLTSPWIMFEAGAISRVVEEGRVCPIVFGVRKTDLVGPLASFQAIEFNRAEVRQLLTTINNAAKEAALLGREPINSCEWTPYESRFNPKATVSCRSATCRDGPIGRHHRLARSPVMSADFLN